jgi:hypothetical protein
MEIAERLPRRAPHRDALPTIAGSHGLSENIEILVVIAIIRRRRGFGVPLEHLLPLSDACGQRDDAAQASQA